MSCIKKTEKTKSSLSRSGINAKFCSPIVTVRADWDDDCRNRFRCQVARMKKSCRWLRCEGTSGAASIGDGGHEDRATDLLNVDGSFPTLCFEMIATTAAGDHRRCRPALYYAALVELESIVTTMTA